MMAPLHERGPRNLFHREAGDPPRPWMGPSRLSHNTPRDPNRNCHRTSRDRAGRRFRVAAGPHAVRRTTGGSGPLIAFEGDRGFRGRLDAAPCEWFDRLASSLDRRVAPRIVLLLLGTVVARSWRSVTSRIGSTRFSD